MPTAGLPFALQIPLGGTLLALFAWLLLDRLGRRCPMGSLGRALLHEPGIINRWRSGSTAPGGCTHCNQCMPTIYSGTRCTLVTP